MCLDLSRQIDRFADDEEQLMSAMRYPDGSNGVGLELGEEDLLFPGHRDASSKRAAPPVDRLDGTVPHSEEFDYTFQEMMQASADERYAQSAAMRQRQGTAFSSAETILDSTPCGFAQEYACILVCTLMPFVAGACSVAVDYAIPFLHDVGCCVSNGCSGHRDAEQGTWAGHG